MVNIYRKKRIGLIGCGKWGKNILRDLVSLGAHVYVAEKSNAMHLDAKKMQAMAVYSDLKELPPCDGYVVAVQIPYLVDVCLELLPYGKPIFCEKTLITSLSDYEKLAKNGGDRLIYCMHKWGYHPGILELRKLMDDGAIGQLREIHVTRLTWAIDFHGSDVIWCHCIHSFTIIRSLLGYIPQQISHLSAMRDADGVISGITAVLCKDDKNVLIVENGRSVKKRSSIELFGTGGSALLGDPLDAFVVLKKHSGEERISIDTTMPLLLELKEFLAFLNGGIPPRFPLSEGLYLANNIFALYEYIEGDRK